MVACPGTAGDTLGQRVDALLEWLCLHLEEDELPKGFDPRGRNLDVIRPGQNFGATAGGAADVEGARTGGSAVLGVDASGGSGGVEPIESLEGRLLRYGFGHAEVARAVAAAGGEGGGEGGVNCASDGDNATTLDARALRPLKTLAGGLAAEAAGSARKLQFGRGGGAGTEDVDVQTEEEGREATDEEVMSLEAIYEGAVSVAPRMPQVNFERVVCGVALDVCVATCVRCFALYSIVTLIVVVVLER